MVCSFAKPPSRIAVVLYNVSVGICVEQQSLRTATTFATEESVEIRSMYPSIQIWESCLTDHNVQFEVMNGGFARCKKHWHN